MINSILFINNTSNFNLYYVVIYMNKILFFIISIFIIIIISFLINNYNIFSKNKLLTNNDKCYMGCPNSNKHSEIYNLHVNHKHVRDRNDHISKKNQIGNFLFGSKGPSNIFIIRHGEDIPNDFALDCNGILRSTYIPNMISKLNDKGIGIGGIITVLQYASMHQPQTVTLASWLLSIPLFIYGEKDESKKIVKELFTNPFFNGKSVIICWHHQCIQDVVKNIITIGPKEKGLHNYTFKNPNNTNGLPFWDKDNFTSVLHFDDKLNFDVFDQHLSTCYAGSNKIIYGKKQKC